MLKPGDKVAYRKGGFGPWIHAEFVTYWNVPKGRKSQISLIRVEGLDFDQKIPSKVLVPVNVFTVSRFAGLS